jgi:hypothetical protein
LGYDFDVSFEVVIPARDNVLSEQAAIVYYTDGSKKDGQTGIGIYDPSDRHFEALASMTTIFQTEMYVICVQKAFK